MSLSLADALPFVPRRDDTPFARRIAAVALSIRDEAVGAYVAHYALTPTERAAVERTLREVA